MPNNYSKVLIVLAALILVALVALVVILVGDDDETAPTAAPTTTVTTTTSTTTLPAPAATTTAPPPPATTTTITVAPPPPTTTSTTPPPTTTTTTTVAPLPVPPIGDLASWQPPGPTPSSDTASGSGCAPGAGPLPDGYWFGYVVARDNSGIDFDLSCLFFGQAAHDAAAADGTTAPNDVYVSNQNPTLRRVPMLAAADVAAVDLPSSGFAFMTYADWPAARPNPFLPCPDTACGVWVFVSGGQGAALVEQYFP